MQKIVSAAYKAFAAGAFPSLIQAMHGDALQRVQGSDQRKMVQAFIGILSDREAFLAECRLDIAHTWRIEQEYKSKATGKAAAKSIRLVHSCIRAWISAFKRFAKLGDLTHLQLVIRAIGHKGDYEVFVEEKAGGASRDILQQYLECGEFLNVPNEASQRKTKTARRRRSANVRPATGAVGFFNSELKPRRT